METSIRRALPDDAPAIARVHVASWRTTYHGIMPEAILASLSEERRAIFWQRQLQEPDSVSMVLVVEHSSDGIIGFAAAGPSSDPNLQYQYRAELQAIYLVAAYQGLGLGRTLFQATVANLKASGYTSYFCWVLTDNPARHFYAAMGGHVVVEGAEMIGGITLRKIAYGWTDPTGSSS